MNRFKSFCSQYAESSVSPTEVSKTLVSEPATLINIDVQPSCADESASPNFDQRKTTSEAYMANTTNCAIIFLGSNNTSSTILFDELQILTDGKCKCFSTAQQSAKYMKQLKKKVVIVVTRDGKQATTLLAACNKLPQLKAIYVLQPNADFVSDRRVSFFTTPITLLHQIQLDMLLCDSDPLAFNFFNLNEKTVRYLTQEGASFMWTQMLIDVLKRFPTDEYAINDMLTMCRKCYHNCPAQLAWIQRFGNTYKADAAIEWYTKDCFLYRVLNKALRTEDTDALYIFRTFIIDLCAQIEEQKRLHYFSHSIVTVYRGQLMFKWELDKFIESIGHLVSVNAFFSASCKEDVASVFAGDETTDGYVKSVLFQIELDTQLQQTMVAPIGHLGNSHVEEEILFSLCSVFKVIAVVPEKGRPWRVHLQATDAGREWYDEYKQLELLDEESPTVEILFGRLLATMGHHKKALKYFTSLVKRYNMCDTTSLAAIVCNRAECLYGMGKFKEVKECSEKGLALLKRQGSSTKDILYLRCRYYLGNSLALIYKVKEARTILEETLREQQKHLCKDHIHIADTLKILGRIQGYEEGYDKAVELRADALKIFEKSLPENHPKRIEAVVSLAGSYRVMGQFAKALEYLQSAIHVQEQFLPNDHSSRASTLREIGLTHEALGDVEMAFDYYCQAYSIWMHQYPEGHVFTAFCLNKIGGIYRIRRQFQEALDCQLCAVEMHTRLFKKGIRHPIHELGKTYLDMGNNEKAKETFRLACAYWRNKTNSPTNIDFCSAKCYLASVYSHVGQYKRAQKLFARVLSLQQSSRSEGNPEIGYTLHHMGSNLMRMNDFDSAMQCYRDSINMLLKFFADDHPEVARIQAKIETLEVIMKDLQEIRPS